jgi:4-hydroxybenzoate polyprenyltransferase
MIIKQSQLDFTVLFQIIITILTILTVFPVYALIDIYDVGYMDIYFYCCFITLIFLLIYLWKSSYYVIMF